MKRKYVMKRPRKHRKYTPQLKASILKAAYASGNVERWAKLNHINPSQLYNWRSQAKAERAPAIQGGARYGAAPSYGDEMRRLLASDRKVSATVVATGNGARVKFNRLRAAYAREGAVPFDVDILRELVRRAIKRYGFDPAKELGL